MIDNKDKFYSLRITAELLGIKTRTLREWIRNGKILAIKYPNSRMWFISEREIDRIRRS